MSTPFLAEVKIFSFNFPPKGWAFCNGQILPINQNQALFSLLGTTYGGNGQTTFALPNLQSQVAIHMGQGAGLGSYVLGQTGGGTSHTLTIQETPAHTHTVVATNDAAATSSPAGALPAAPPSPFGNVYGDGSDSAMSSGAVTTSGGGQPHNNIQPYLALNFCMALQGIFPSQT